MPREWKLANITPLHKSGVRDNVSNYRPVSLTPVCCKTLEHIIYSCLIKHLQDNNFFTPSQHGFRAGLSCVTQLTEFVHDIASSFDQGIQLEAVFLDFKKAFDVVPHSLLLHKLSFLGIPKTLIDWIKDYLSGRKQCVVINGVSSSTADVLSGVPQGSVLGPLLFLIFINDFPLGLKSTVRLYADDCVLYCPVKCFDDTTVLQSDLDKIVSWCAQWQMSLNLTKCFHVQFNNKKR